MRVPVKSLPSTERDALTRDDVRALIDSMRADKRALGDSASRSSARENGMAVSRVDSVVNARLQSAEAARRAERDGVARATRNSVQRAQVERDAVEQDRVSAQQADDPPSWDARRATVYGGLTVTNGTQAIAGVRVDFGPLSRDFNGVHFLPEIALGWGGGARSIMVAGSLQLGLPTLRFGRWPAIIPQVEAGLGVLNFSDPLSRYDGTDGVVNLGYGVGIDLWDRAAGGARPVLVIEHQGVDLFKLDRVLAGVRWTF